MLQGWGFLTVFARQPVPSQCPKFCPGTHATHSTAAWFGSHPIKRSAVSLGKQLRNDNDRLIHSTVSGNTACPLQGQPLPWGPGFQFEPSMGSPLLPWDPVNSTNPACVWEKGPDFEHEADILALTRLKGNTNMSVNAAI